MLPLFSSFTSFLLVIFDNYAERVYIGGKYRFVLIEAHCTTTLAHSGVFDCRRVRGFAKTILQGTVMGTRRRGGQGQIWDDNNKEWTGLEFGESQSEARDRQKRKELVAGLSVVHLLRDRIRKSVYIIPMIASVAVSSVAIA